MKTLIAALAASLISFSALAADAPPVAADPAASGAAMTKPHTKMQQHKKPDMKHTAKPAGAASGPVAAAPAASK
jgi:hypothetical protein